MTGREAPTAVVTGAGWGIGRAVAARLADDGYRIVALDIDAEAAVRTGAEVGGVGLRCDVSDRAEVARAVERIDRCDAVVNNAGIWRYQQLTEVDEIDARAVIDVNLLGVLFTCQALVDHLTRSEHGCVVNISSLATFGHPSGVGIYPATKAAVESLTKQMALEWGPRGIRANAVAPGRIPTEGTLHGYDDERARQRAASVPLRRLGQPDEIANVVSFLCSDAARYVSGQVIYVDGGVSAGIANP
jgi:3-oxoacyl-[acyl-carrier protein] reductase